MNAFWALLPFLPAAVSFAMVPYAWRRRSVPGATALAVLMLALGVWGLFYALELLAGADEPVKTLWAKLKYAGVVVTPTAWLGLSLGYAGLGRWLTHRVLLLLAVMPVTVFALVLGNDVHRCVWQSQELVQSGPYTVLAVVFGPMFWLHTAYSYALMAFGTAHVLWSLVQRPPLYRRQAAALVLAVAAPWVGNGVYIFGASPVPGLDLTPFAFMVSEVALTWGLLRYRLLEIVPVARTAVVEGMAAGMLVLDMQDHVVDCNPAAARILGLVPDQVIGQPAAQALAPWPELLAAYRATATAGAELRLGEGPAARDYELQLSPLADREGRYRGRLLALHDVTDRRRAEEALRERTRELQARNEDLDAFAHTVAHDLKHSLSVIIGYSDVMTLDEGNLSLADLRECAAMIAQQGRRMNGILEELLLLAGVRQTEAPRLPLDTAALVSGACQRLGDVIRQHEAEIRVPAEWPAALGYGPWIEEVWVNYLSNAILHGGRPPRVELGATVLSGGQVCFWVQDNGRGVPPETRTRLFTPFARLDQVRATGHGLGLSIVRRIVEKLDGEVGLESIEGQGSRFTFTLPGVGGPS